MMERHNGLIVAGAGCGMKTAGLIAGMFFVVMFSVALYVVTAANGGFDLKGCYGECRVVQKEAIALCKVEYSECREGCDNSICRRECSREKTVCVRAANEEYSACKGECKAASMPRCTAGNESYSYKDTFEQGCEVCSCERNGRVRCKTDAFCNLNVTVDENTCVTSGGLFQGLCNGNYFQILCTQDEYCLCEGNSEWSCPADYTCLKEFNAPNPRKTQTGWKNMLGQPLGDIGVCGI